MNRHLLPLLLLLICQAGMAMAGDNRVPARDPWAIQFSGLEAFDQESIRHALLRHRDLRKAQASQVDGTQFLSLLESLVESGVRSNGFPEAAVSVSQHENGTIHVNVEPGPMWKWGQPKVVAANAAGDVAGLTRFFKDWADEEFRGSSGLKGWSSASFLNTSTTAATAISELAKTAAKRDFLEGFNCKVDFDFHSETREVVPVVRVSEPGFHTLISEVIFEGNRINSDQVLQEFLQIPEGARFDGELNSRIRTKLMNSGRILHVKVACDAPFAEDHAVPLRIRLHERADAVALNEPLPEYEQAICNLATWLSDWKDPTVELQVVVSTSPSEEELRQLTSAVTTNDPSTSATSFDPAGALGTTDARRCVLTCTAGKTSGYMLRIEVADAESQELCHYGMMLSHDVIGICDFQSQRKWTRTGDLPSITNTLTFHGTEDPEKPRAFFFAPGVTTSREAPPVHTKLEVEPAALIFDLKEKLGDTKPILENGICSIIGPKLSVKFEADSGRLLSLKATEGMHQFELRCGSGLLKQELAKVSSDELQEQSITGRELSTLIRFLMPYVRRGLPEESDGKLLALFDRSLSEGSSLDRIFTQMTARQETRTFSVPADVPTVGGTVSQPWFMQWIETASTPGSPVDRLLALLDDNMGDPEIKKAFLEEFQRHEEIGPAGCLCLSLACQGVKRQIALEGMSRLNFASFRHDIEMIFAEDSAFHDFTIEIIQFVRQMTVDEVELVAITVETLTSKNSPAEQAANGVNVRPVFALARAPGVTLDQAMDSLMQMAWEMCIRDQLRQLLATQAEITATPIDIVGDDAAAPQNDKAEEASEKPDFFRNASADAESLLDAVKPFDAPAPE